MSLLRHPAFGTGLVLLVLGLGNWAVARTRLSEFADPSVNSPVVAPLGHYEDFAELDARTNAELLRPLQRGVNPTTTTEVRVDFYKVVQTGGKLIAFVGIGLMLFASAKVWRVHRDALVPTSPY